MSDQQNQSMQEQNDAELTANVSQSDGREDRTLVELVNENQDERLID